MELLESCNYNDDLSTAQNVDYTELSPSDPLGPYRNPIKEFGHLPNSAAHDPRLGHEALALLAYRSTFVGNFALNVGAAQLGLPMGNGKRGRTIGKNRLKAALAECVCLGYILRRQPKSSGKASFSFARASMGNEPGEPFRMAYRHWHDGSLTSKQIAALVFIRAHNRSVWKNEVQARFDWTESATSKIISGLVKAGELNRLLWRNPNGPGIVSTYQSPKHATVQNQPDYVHPAPKEPISARLEKANRHKKVIQKSGHVKPGHTRIHLMIVKHESNALFRKRAKTAHPILFFQMKGEGLRDRMKTS